VFLIQNVSASKKNVSANSSIREFIGITPFSFAGFGRKSVRSTQLIRNLGTKTDKRQELHFLTNENK
jgi:hypothetical protein